MSLSHFSTLYYEIGGFKLIFNQILLHILFILKNERTVSSAYHLLRGKRSGQTIQDVGMYKLHCYFGILPKLKRTTFDEAIFALQAAETIQVDVEGYYTMKDELQFEHIPYFNGWHYRGNEHRFFSRLALLVETLSYTKEQISYFAPTEKNVESQMFLRSFLQKHPFREEAFRHQILSEVTEALDHPLLNELQRDIVVARLSGANVAGLTWQQLAQKYAISELDVQLNFISALHGMLAKVKEKPLPLMNQLADNVYISMPLTDSTYETAKLLNEGKSLEQIAAIRRLKISTIEDHVVEIVMNLPTFNIAAFLSKEQLKEINETSEAYATKKLRVLKEVLPHYSYFQLRLGLAKGE
jgi:uncharacterized protein YpbB